MGTMENLKYSLILPSFLLILVVFVTTLIFSCASYKQVSRGYFLNGNWIPVKQEMGGNDLPKAFYEKQVLLINDDAYTLTAESVDRGNLNYGDGKMEIEGKEGVNAGKTFKAIYKLEGNTLTICYNLRGDKYPTNFQTKDEPFYFLSVFIKSEN